MARNPDDVLYRKGVTVKPSWGERWLTKEEALAWIKVWKNMNVPKCHLHFSMMNKTAFTSGVENVYLTKMISDLIERIRESDDDPVTTVANYYLEMDEILATSDDDHFITHRFAGYMERASHEVLMFLKEKEKELNQK